MLPTLYALLGSPVSGSKSPFIHNLSFSLNDINASYEAIEVPPEALEATLSSLVEKGYGGFNITIPHKEAVLAHLDDVDALARQMGAVNTIVVREGHLKGYNTDGPGLVMALEQAGLVVKGLRVLILGAGGAAKGIAHSLAIYGASKIFIHNRTEERALGLVEDLREYPGLESGVFTSNGEDFDLVINTTSVGMMPKVDEMPMDPSNFPVTTAFCDIVYKPHETLFLKRAKAMGSKCIYGIDMLMMQALLSEIFWTGKEIDLTKTLEVLKSEYFKGL